MGRFEADVTLTMKWHLAIEAQNAEEAREKVTEEIGLGRANDPDYSDMKVSVERGVS